MPRPNAPTLSEDVIVTAALRLIEERGPEEFSMRNLAQTLGVAPMSLYHYFPTKDDLRRAAYVRVLNELSLPAGGTWAERLERLARDFRALCLRHRHVAPYLMEQHPPAHPEVRLLEFLLATLREAGVPEEALWPAASNLISTLLGFLVREVTGPDRAVITQQTGAFALAHPAPYPTLARLAGRGHLHGGAFFEVQLQLLLGGIAALVPASGAARAPAGEGWT